MHPRIVLFVGNFFFSIGIALVVYVLLPFLSGFISQVYAGLVITLGGLVSIISFLYLPKLVARYGAQRLALLLVLIATVALSVLATTHNSVAAILFSVVIMALQPLVMYELDLLLEAITVERSATARIRTLFITASSLGALTAPLILGLVLDGTDEYFRVFLTEALAIIPFAVLLSARALPQGEPPQSKHLRDTLVCMARDPDLGAVTFAHFLFYLFSIWASFYVPIYLHGILAIPWSTLGWMFSIMLLPYIFLEYPAGWLADRYLGDKKLLFAGFTISGIALISLSFMNASSSLLLILGILISSRVGAALIESMTEGHFFRRVTERDINSISVFRGIWPLANLVGPVVAGILLSFGSFPFLFVCTGGFILIAGILTTIRLHDYI